MAKKPKTATPATPDKPAASPASEKGRDEHVAPDGQVGSGAGRCSCFAIFLLLFTVISAALVIVSHNGDRLAHMPVDAHNWLQSTCVRACALNDLKFSI